VDGQEHSAGYLKVDRSTIYRVVRRWVEEGPEGLEDKKRGRPKGETERRPEGRSLRAMDAVRRLQENPELSGRSGCRRPWSRPAYISASEPLAGSSKPTATSTSWTNQRGVRIRSARCRSRRAPDTRSGHRMCALHGPLPAGNGQRLRHLDPRELLQGNPREECANAHPGHERLPLSVLYAAIERYGSPKRLLSDAEAASSAPVRPPPSTGLSASREKRSSAANPGKASSRDHV
jgi:hypothetical protein